MLRFKYHRFCSTIAFNETTLVQLCDVHCEIIFLSVHGDPTVHGSERTRENSCGSIPIVPLFSEIRYLQIFCNTHLKVGFVAGDGMHYHSLPQSQSRHVLELQRGSNFQQPGQWMFKIDGENIENPGKESLMIENLC